MSTYNMQCPMAAHRLIKSGMPATREHEVHSARPGAPASTAVAVAETVQHFITAMDSLKLNLVAVDQVYPLLSDLAGSLMKARWRRQRGGLAPGGRRCRACWPGQPCWEPGSYGSCGEAWRGLACGRNGVPMQLPHVLRPHPATALPLPARPPPRSRRCRPT